MLPVLRLQDPNRYSPCGEPIGVRGYNNFARLLVCANDIRCWQLYVSKSVGFFNLACIRSIGRRTHKRARAGYGPLDIQQCARHWIVVCIDCLDFDYGKLGLGRCQHVVRCAQP